MEKMSKSKGNIIDPLEIIDIYGTDAMRMGLCASATHARQIDLDRRRFEEFKNFSNKIWNGTRFIFLNLETLSTETFAKGLDLDELPLEDKWILSLQARTIQDVEEHLTDYAFDRAAMTAYDFFWKDFCAYYIELVKPILFGKSGTEEQRASKQKILCIVLCNIIRLLHPMAPFITEEIFQMLKTKFSGLTGKEKADPYTMEAIHALCQPACIVAPYPKVIRESDINPQIESTFAFLGEVVRTVRNIRAEMQLPPGTATDLHIYSSPDEEQSKLLQNNLGIIQALVRTKNITFAHVEQKMPFTASSIVGNLKLVIPLPDELKEKEKVRLIKERDKYIAQTNTLRQQMSNTEFLEKAPPQLIEKFNNNLAQAEKELNETMRKLEELGIC